VIPSENASAASRESDYFDRLILEQGDFNPFADSAWETLAGRFEQWLPASDGVELLDVGCGTGASFQIYRRRAKRYVGLDLSDRAIELARKKAPEREWLVGDACRLPFADGTFDVVAFSSVLHHIPDFSRAVTEATRVIRPGGTVFAFDPNVYHPGMLLLRHPRSPFYLREGVSADERPLRPSALRAAFQAAGLTHIAQEARSGLAYRRVGPKPINSALGFFNTVDSIWQTIGLGRWCGAFVLTVGRKPQSLSP
jgi:ubiquinone/menaquinone biosynthesis C-methylase UbiE